ncbi:MAG TPA: amidohydrolase family protein [Pyrinomonadaceae bacterium]|jgi:imidazolonepropionase-like amidohydrolase|nr:amidohydrolase family protein [Pyrinomonadaceae bacterium]
MRAKLFSNVFARINVFARVPVALAALLLLSVAATSTSAQQASSTMGTQFMSGTPGTFAIRNARIVTVSGADIENGTIVISDGRITAVGANAAVPAGAQEIDARGLSVYPGMIDLGTSMGLIEIPQGANATVDVAEVGDMNPNAQAFYGINPHSAHVAVTRVNGITSVLSSPSGGIVSGQAAFINLLGSSPREMAVVPTAALVVNYPRAAGGGGFGGFFQQPQANPAEAATARDRQVEQLRKLLRDAEAYGRAMDAANADRNLPRPDADVMLASLVPYVRGERPVIFRADREAEMRAVVRFSEEMKLKPIILGGNDAWKIAAFLKERNVPVILNGLFDLPSREDDFYDVMYESAAKLQQAGVRFALSTGDQGAEVRDLPYRAGMAAAFGLSRADALKSVTLYPAQIMGVGDRLGSIDVGKIANLVITDGDILEARTHIRHLFINGRQVPLNSRHTELYEQFRNRK